jgi:hypothetical protein
MLTFHQGSLVSPRAAGPGGGMTGAQLEAYTESLEQRLQSVGEDAQLTSSGLQRRLKSQELLLQTMSNVSKARHDAAMGVIRKIG